MIVQATPEDGEQGLIHHLREASHIYPSRIFRGTIVGSTSANRDITKYEHEKVDDLHAAGVRCIRVQGIYSDVGEKSSTLRDYLVATATSYPVAQLGWSICMQLPLATWEDLHGLLLDDPRLADANIIADHNANATPDDIGSSAFELFLDILRRRPGTYVKIGALHRRSPRDINRMREVVEVLASAAPQGILWGSDFPHVDTTGPAFVSMPHIAGVDEWTELEAVKEWLSDVQFYDMMVVNPGRLFT